MSGSTCENKIAYSNLHCVHVVNVLAQSYDSPLRLRNELVAWYIEPQLGYLHKGLCDLIIDSFIFVTHILCYDRSLTRGGAGIVSVSFT